MNCYPVPMPGYEGRLVIEREGWFAPARLLLDNEPVETSGRRHVFTLPRDGKLPLIGRLRYRFLDPIPKVQVGSETVVVVPSFTWYEWILMCLPMLLVFFDPVLGALIGAVAATLNGQIFRSEWPQPQKIAAAAAVGVAGYGLYRALIAAAQLLVR